MVEGDTFMEATGVWHKGRNTGDKPARILVVFMGSETASNVIRRD
ncbi:MAG: cupin domain-containing protein [Pseudomonadota bacterium]|nr:cupin domain-containing protein [Pseudomonadota bacterium]